MNSLLDLYQDIPKTPHLTSEGRITGSRGNMLLATLPHASLGDLCYINTLNGDFPAQVVAFKENSVTLAPFKDIQGISTGATVRCSGAPPQLKIEHDLRGQILDATGLQITNEVSSCSGKIALNLFAPPPNPLTRQIIKEQLYTGVSAIDILCPIGYGQRIGLFASAGVGKSTLLGMIARNSAVDVVVIGLIGERGREVREFIEESLGVEGLKRSVVVVSTSDEAPVRRTLAAYTATTIAEYYRDQGCKVLLLMDSITRTARAIRDVGLSAGELPVRHGYTSSVYSELPRLLERSGMSDKGSITAIYNVLTDNERELDPLAEELKSILDGHITLNRQIAERGILPAIDITASISRVLNNIVDKEAINSARKIIKMVAKIRKDRDIVLLGGTPDAELEFALKAEPLIDRLISQDQTERRTIEQSKALLSNILNLVN